MSEHRFKAIVVREDKSGHFHQEIEERNESDLPEGEITIKVKYSSLNYKDALSATGHKGVTKKYPHTPGIDAAGVVLSSKSDRFQPNQEVIVTGYDLGMNTAGGFGQMIRVPTDWVVAKPEGLSLKECMIYGTAGFTAAQSLLRLEHAGLNPDKGDVLVTGATGGVGSMAVGLLHQAGYRVTAATGSLDQHDFLKKLGATSIIGREEVDDRSGKPMLKSRWAGVVDTVGGNILSTALKSTTYRAPVTCCGLVASPEFDCTVYPFILRGVQLYGVDSAECPMESRLKIWENLSGKWKLDCLEDYIQEVTLGQMRDKVHEILKGQVNGRVVLKHE